MTQSLANALTKYPPPYEKLFDRGHILTKDSKKGWVISRAPLPTAKQMQFFETLVLDLVQENFSAIEGSVSLIIRINAQFQKICLPKGFPAEILFKSTSREFSFLSNFFPTLILYNNRLFHSSEHLYQWRVVVALRPDSEGEAFAIISRIPEPLKARNYAHEVKKTVARDLPPEAKLSIMAEVTALKYSQSPGLQAALVATEGRHLREDTENPFWGGEENNMGRILMAARLTLLQQPVTEEKERQS